MKIKNKKWIYGFLIVVLIAAGVTWKLLKKNKKGKFESSQYVTVTQGPIAETVEATGEVSPQNRVEIKPPISGRIEKLLVDEGANVKAGQILAWMSSSDRAAILDAARAQSASEYKHWEDSYKPTPVVAPLSGIIILKNVVVGQTVDPSLVLYAMSDNLIVLAQVDEADIGRVRMRMPAVITLDAYPQNEIEGTVTQILQEGKNVSNVITYGVKIEPKKAPDYFRSQMTANVRLIVRQEEDAILVPASAVRDRSGEKQVMVKNTEGKADPREIETGIESGENVQVLSGLNAGEEVLITRARYVPQKGAQNSPFTMGGRSGSGGGSGSSRSNRRQ